MDALESGRHDRAAACTNLGPFGVPAADQDMIPDQQIALIAVTFRLGQQRRVAGRRYIQDPESIVISLKRELALKREVGTNHPLTVRHRKGRGLW